MSATRPALFLDRDGVINADRGFVARKEDFVWVDGIFALVRMARARGVVPVVVTNQSGIGRGLYSLADYDALTAWMLERFAAEQAPIARVYYCPYHPEAVLPQFRAVHDWRKPAPGMLLAAQADLGLDMVRSVLIGNRWSDVEAGRRAGVGHLVLVGPTTQAGDWSDAASIPPGLVRCATLADVLDWFAQTVAS